MSSHQLKFYSVTGGDDLWEQSMADKLIYLHQSKNFWDKYGNFVMFGATIAIIFLIFYFFFGKLDALQGLGQSMATVAEQNKQMIMLLKQNSVLIPSQVGV